MQEHVSPGKTSSRYKLLRQTNPMSLPLHVTLSPETHPIVAPSVAQALPATEK
jgi:hypothetical protein